MVVEAMPRDSPFDNATATSASFTPTPLLALSCRAAVFPALHGARVER